MGKSSLSAASRAAIVHQAIRGGVWGLGTDEKALLDALDGLSPEDATALRQEYAQHYHRNLMEDLGRDLHHGTHRHRAVAAAWGNRWGAEAWAFKEELKRGYGHPRPVLERLGRAVDTGAYDEIDAHFRGIGRRSLEDAVGRSLTGVPREKALTLIHQGPCERPGESWRRAMEDALHPLLPECVQPGVVLALLKQAPPQAEQNFSKVEKKPLREVLGAHLRGDDLALAMALLDGDSIRSAAIIAHAALSDDKAGAAMLLEAFDQTNMDRRARIARAYSQLYDQSLEEDIQNKGGVLGAIGKRIYGTGRKEVVDEIRALSELGAWDVILQALQRMPAPLIQATDALYRHHYGKSLRDDLSARLPRDRRLDLDRAWRGQPSSPVERAERALQEWTDIRAGKVNAPARVVMDGLLHSPQGQLIDGTANAVKDALARAKTDETHLPELNVLARFLEEDVSAYQHARMRVTMGAVMLGSLATGTAMFALGGISLPFLNAAGFSTGMNAGWRILAKVTLLGKTYRPEDLRRELAWSVGAGLGSALAGMAAQDVARPLADLLASTRSSSSELGVAAQSYWQASMLRPLTIPLEHMLQSAGLFGGGFMATTSLERQTWANGVGDGLLHVSLAGLKGVTIGLGYGALQSAVSIALGMTPNANFLDASAKSSMTVQTASGPREIAVYGHVSEAQKEILTRELQDISDKTSGRALIGLDSVYVHPLAENLGGYMNSQSSIALSDRILGPDGNLGVIAHELGHHIDPGEPGFLPKGAWVALFGDGSPFGSPPYVTNYASMDRWEDFAETHEALIQNWGIYTAPGAGPALEMADPLWPKVKWILDNVYPNNQ